MEQKAIKQDAPKEICSLDFPRLASKKEVKVSKDRDKV